MSIQSISAVNFTGKKRYTNNGNEYEKTNAGKYVGMGVGAAAGAGYPAYILHNMFKPENKGELMKLLDTYCKNFNESCKNQFGQDVKLTTKTLTKCIKALPVVSGAVVLLAGLGLGAIVDGIINHNRAKKADKEA